MCPRREATEVDCPFWHDRFLLIDDEAKRYRGQVYGAELLQEGEPWQVQR